MKYRDNVKNRLKRVEGQVRGVLSMMETDKDCKEVVSQLSAIRSAVDKAIALIVAENLAACIKEELAEGRDTDQVVQEAIQLLVKSR
ncbi:metal-sensitive transcriptional regulator [Brevibacillus borstelensis]|uniref:metal-sensitive transcriptional regulator n=1 Tax=Brevibacillus borstelensis TaxID=45462 RepID=UPI0004686466|nr:metal-sensitive transcriptional regulator [Brevibacillus borstelensis]KKX56547.1 cytoplasmic protein [Brevibacillus borstelensis cifa_chp40]KYB86597.1 cytoplasmic protein [Salmonella enterica subsp. enterica]KYB86598.1 cytoplasmic protein [Salmonella enterica subsp. enterica]